MPSDTDVAILTEGGRAARRDELAGYEGRRFPFRVWWVRDYGAMSLGGLVALVQPARAVERDRRAAGVALRTPGRRGQRTVKRTRVRSRALKEPSRKPARMRARESTS